MIEERSFDDAKDSSFHEGDEADFSEEESIQLKKIIPRKNIDIDYHETSENENSGNSDEDDDTDEVFLRIGTKTAKKGLINKSKKIQKSDFNVYDFLLGWRKNFNVFHFPNDPKSYKQVLTDDLSNLKLDEYAQSLQALYININWKTEGNSEGKSILDLKNINLSSKLVNNGILFIWSEKELINDIIKILEIKNFVYIENFAVILINPKLLESKKNSENPTIVTNKENAHPKCSVNSKITSFFKVQPKKELFKELCSDLSNETKKINEAEAELIKNNLKAEKMNENYTDLNKADPRNLFDNQDSDYFYKSKRVLLMFRRNETKTSQTLELRHQRTSDVVFDLVNKDTNWKINEYVYKMIETLLPKANYGENSNSGEEFKFKMMELYANSKMPRKGWIGVCENKSSN